MLAGEYMGVYLNPGNEAFRQAVTDEIYVDKTKMISLMNKKLNKSRVKYVCVSLPRRFGKSMVADMLVAYYSKGCDSGELFAGRMIEDEDSFQTHLNQHNVIRLDIQRFLQEIQKAYLNFLRGLFKGAEYVELAYMTGILPIKKYGEHSAINIFDEYSMIDPKNLGGYFGFTRQEVREQCDMYDVDYAEVEKWYDGYQLGDIHIYNPKSVVDVMTWKKFKSYWTGTETYEALKIYIDQNFDGLKEAVTMMLGNGRCKINPRRFQNDMTTFSTKDDVLTLLIHLGYLTFDERTDETFIPNQEIAQEFLNAVEGYYNFSNTR